MKPDVVADFVRAHLVRGFANDRARARRAGVRIED
jgi:hypothetical protein